MKEVMLTQGKVTIVDDEDYDYLSQWKWYYHETSRKTGKGYACRNKYLGKGEDGRYHQKRIWMHREITRCEDGMNVDHIDGNRLNNTKENLRICTPKQNSANRIKQNSPTSSIFKGVRKVDNRYRCVVKNTHMGTFTSELACANAYNHYAIKMFGDFAKLNELEYMDEEKCRSHQITAEGISQYVGVSWDSKRKMWASNIYIEGKKYFIGYFNSEVESAIARNNKILEIGLSSKMLNSIPEDISFTPTPKKETSSKYIGIHFSQRWNKWKSEIIISRNNRVHVGTFNSEEDAYIARKNKMIELGLYEKLNKEEKKYRVFFGEVV